MDFTIDRQALKFILALTSIILILWIPIKRFGKPRLLFSSLGSFLAFKLPAARWHAFPEQLLWLSFGFFLLAYLNPRCHFIKKEMIENLPLTQGCALYLVMDISPSMKNELPQLQEWTKKFISGDSKNNLAGRKQDLIGLIAFARGAQVLAPLTFDHQTLLKEIDALKVIQSKSQEGTAIGYAIYKTAHLIQATRHFAEKNQSDEQTNYIIKASAIILITDGLQDPNTLDQQNALRMMDIPDAAQYAKEQGIKIYIINLNKKLLNKEFEPQLKQLVHAASMTGGKLFTLQENSYLSQIYAEIDRLEKTPLPWPNLAGLKQEEFPELFEQKSFWPLLIALALSLILLALFFETFIFRKIP